ncbi:hypothetical protein ACOSP7_016339 [Xanthoceras sorbifolium]
MLFPSSVGRNSLKITAILTVWKFLGRCSTVLRPGYFALRHQAVQQRLAPQHPRCCTSGTATMLAAQVTHQACAAIQYNNKKK